MTVKYLDPYKDDKYGKLRGDKSEAYFGISFDEAIVHKTEDAYIIAGFAIAYTSIVRGFKPENPLTPGLCAVPIYGKDYEIRKKDKDGNWSSETITPSLFEKALYAAISADEDNWIPHNAAIAFSMTHIPNGMLQGKTEAEASAFATENITLSQVDLSGKLPQYTPPSNNGQRKSGGKSWGISPDEKVAFLKKQLAEDIKADGFTKDSCLGDLVDQLILEHADDDKFSEIYFDMVISCVR